MLPVVRDHIIAAQNARRNNILRRRRLDIRNTSDPFSMSEIRFIELFRLNKRLARNLIHILRDHIPLRRSLKGISLEIKVLTALRYYATGSYQRCIGQDFFTGLSQTAVQRCVHSITDALSTVAINFINMPDTQQERNFLKTEIMNKWGFPGVIGFIDGFHVAICKPKENEQNFINRKGFHSINVQLICDHQLKIRNILVNFGGSTHDSFIWRNSEAQEFMRNLNNQGERCWLLGDSGYPLQPYLMTPFRNANNGGENAFNHAHCSARNTVERCIGVLKMRFRCLLKERSARYEPQFMCQVVKACAVLHNMCIDENIEFEHEFHEEDHPPQQIAQPVPNNNAGMNIRNNILNRYFL